MAEGAEGRGRPQTISAAEYKRLAAGQDLARSKKNKFGAHALTNEHGAFDSKGEYLRYLDLMNLQRSGIIHDLKRQVRMPLIVNGQELKIRDKNGRGKRLAYIADFTYREGEDLIVEDFKGYDTPVSRIKRAVVEAMHGLTVRVTRR
jgi:hypothetical protein